MATYYNGIEITSSKTISGVSLAGKSSFTFGGKTITLNSPPPPASTIILYGNGTYASTGDACSFGPGERKGTTGYVFDGGGRYAIYKDSGFVVLFPDGFFWTDDTTSIGGSVGSFWVEISGGLVGFDVC